MFPLLLVEVDLFSFDDPAPAPTPVSVPSTNDASFGAFQATPAPTSPAAGADDEFGAFVASKASGPDPFAAPTAPQPASVASFDAFGNNASALPQQNNAMMGGVGMAGMNNNMNGGFSQINPMTTNSGGMQNMTNAFGNMNVGHLQQADAVDDGFGDFADAPPKSSPTKSSNPADPMAKLVNLDGLFKNPNKVKRTSKYVMVPI